MIITKSLNNLNTNEISISLSKKPKFPKKLLIRSLEASANKDITDLTKSCTVFKDALKKD